MNHLREIVTTKHPTSVRVLKRLLAPIYYRCRLFIRPLWRIGTLPWYIAVLLVLRRRSSFKFVEIGVFKGDNAVRVIEVAKRFTTSIQYVGFDLFEENETFFELHAEDRAQYDNPGDSYWEFQSGQHTLAEVHNKLSTVLAEADFALVEGDSTRTVPAYHERLTNATVIYIDGCHDYDIVVQDWYNVRALINANPLTIVAFDDMLYPGVARLKMEIEQAKDLYCVFSINMNQFMVTSKNLPWRERHLLRLMSAKHLEVW